MIGYLPISLMNSNTMYGVRTVDDKTIYDNVPVIDKMQNMIVLFPYNNRRVPWIRGNGNRVVPRGTTRNTDKLARPCVRPILYIEGTAGPEITYASAERLERLRFRTWIRVTAIDGHIVCFGLTLLCVNKAAEKSQPTDQAHNTLQLHSDIHDLQSPLSSMTT